MIMKETITPTSYTQVPILYACDAEVVGAAAASIQPSIHLFIHSST